MYEIMLDLVVMIAPVLSFTMEEVWQFMKKPASMPESVFMMPWPECKEEYIDEALESKWDNFIEIRSEITRVWKVPAALKLSVILWTLKSSCMLQAKRWRYSDPLKVIWRHC